MRLICLFSVLRSGLLVAVMSLLMAPLAIAQPNGGGPPEGKGKPEDKGKPESTKLSGKGGALVGGLEASLNARYSKQGNSEQFIVAVEELNLPPGELNVCVDGAPIGTLPLDEEHGGSFRLNGKKNDLSGLTVADGTVVGLAQGDCATLTIFATLSSGPSGDAEGLANNEDRKRLVGRGRALVNEFLTQLLVRYDSRGERERLHVVVNNLNGPTMVKVCVGATELGMIDLMENHSGDLELNSNDGPVDLPEFNEGDVIDIQESSCAGEPLISAVLGGGPPFGAPIGPAETLRSSAKGNSKVDGFMGNLNARFDENSRRTRLRISIENINAMGTLTVCIDGVSIGTIDLDEAKSGELELSTENGDTVPQPADGATVAITEGGCGGEPLISATFVSRGKPSTNNSGKSASRSRIKRGRSQ